MMTSFDYVKPELIDSASFGVRGDGEGESCPIDCTADAICPGSDDEI